MHWYTEMYMKLNLMAMFAATTSTGTLFSWLRRITLGARKSLRVFATYSSLEAVVSIRTSLVRPVSIVVSEN
jgi:hypothetical protein